MFIILTALVGCDGKDSDSGVAAADLLFTDAHNYTYSGSVNAASYDVAERVDVCIDWSGLSVDFRGREMVAADVDTALLVRLRLSQQEVLADIASNDLSQKSVIDIRDFYNSGGGQACLSEFEILGNPFDPATSFVCDADSSWLISLASSIDGRDDFRTLGFIDPCSGSSATSASFDDDTATLDFTADLSTGQRLEVTSGTTGDLDWSGLTTDATGHALDPESADRLMIGRVDAAAVSDVEALFVQLLDQTDALYHLETYGTDRAALSDATAADGTPFDGFTTDGVWLLGLECLGCTSPAPIALTVVDVTDG